MRLPDDWKALPLAGKAQTMVDRWQAGEIERELAKFRNYWLAKGGKDACRTDWQRTWINWLISADERKPRNVSLQRNRTNPTLDLLRAANEAIAAESEDRQDYLGTRAALPAPH